MENISSLVSPRLTQSTCTSIKTHITYYTCPPLLCLSFTFFYLFRSFCLLFTCHSTESISFSSLSLPKALLSPWSPFSYVCFDGLLSFLVVPLRLPRPLWHHVTSDLHLFFSFLPSLPSHHLSSD